MPFPRNSPAPRIAVQGGGMWGLGGRPSLHEGTFLPQPTLSRIYPFPIPGGPGGKRSEACFGLTRSAPTGPARWLSLLERGWTASMPRPNEIPGRCLRRPWRAAGSIAQIRGGPYAPRTGPSWNRPGLGWPRSHLDQPAGGPYLGRPKPAGRIGPGPHHFPQGIQRAGFAFQSQRAAAFFSHEKGGMAKIEWVCWTQK